MLPLSIYLVYTISLEIVLLFDFIPGISIVPSPFDVYTFITSLTLYSFTAGCIKFPASSGCILISRIIMVPIRHNFDLTEERERERATLRVIVRNYRIFGAHRCAPFAIKAAGVD